MTNQTPERLSNGKKRDYLMLAVNCIGVQLTKGYVAIIDAEDFHKIDHVSWYACESTNCTYAKAKTTKFKLSMHSAIIGSVKGMQIDHINGDGLDNRKSNLRLCTYSQNQANARPRAGGSSKYKGVFYKEKEQKFFARIKHNRKAKHLGSFTDEAKAAQAYDMAALEAFGQFAYTNFPKENYNG